MSYQIQNIGQLFLILKKKNIKNIYLFQFIGNYIICRNGHSLLQPTGLAQLGDAAITVPESSQLWSAERTM